MSGSAYSICWKCKLAYAGCSWSRDLRPISGWQTQQSDIREDGIRIVECPQFEKAAKKNEEVKPKPKLTVPFMQ